MTHWCIYGYSETQQFERRRCENMLGFTRIWVILGFLIDFESYILSAILSPFRSTQPTFASNLPLHYQTTKSAHGFIFSIPNKQNTVAPPSAPFVAALNRRLRERAL